MRSIGNQKRLRAVMGAVFAGLFIATTAFAISGSVPNTFVPNTVAKSSEVNANFTFVNYGNIVVRDYNGVEIGALLGPDNSNLRVINSNDYQFRMNATGAVMAADVIYYTTSDCTGTEQYVDARYTMRGSVFVGPSLGLYYVPKTASYVVSAVIQGQSFYSYESWSCIAQGTSATTFFQIIPNNSTVTGVTSSSFPGPITIERR